MPERMSEEMPERMSEDVPERRPEDVPERLSERMSEEMPERMPEEMPERMSEKLPSEMPERVSENIPGRLSDRMSWDLQRLSDRMSEDLPERSSGDMPRRMSDRMSGDSQRMSHRLSQRMSDRMFRACFIFRAVEIISDGAPACLCPDRRCADMSCGWSAVPGLNVTHVHIHMLQEMLGANWLFQCVLSSSLIHSWLTAPKKTCMSVTACWLSSELLRLVLYAWCPCMDSCECCQVRSHEPGAWVLTACGQGKKRLVVRETYLFGSLVC